MIPNARRILDDAGLAHVEIFASGGLDEDAIARLVREGAPITGFGVRSVQQDCVGGDTISFGEDQHVAADHLTAWDAAPRAVDGVRR